MTELNKEDYVEPRCILISETDNIPQGITPIPQQRVIEKMDEYMSHRDYAGAERHLLYWLQEAKAGHDKRGELLVQNELVGHFRKTGQQEKAFESAKEALRLIKELDYDGTISSGTTYTNIGTMYNAFGRDEDSLTMFQKALAIYESSPNTGKELLGGLYNNLALTLVKLGRFGEADTFYDKAIEAMKTVPYGQLEIAITLLNKANAVEDEVGLMGGESRIFGLLDEAIELLDTPSIPRGGYYAFVLEKCAPTLEYYGYFADAKRLMDTAEAIYQQEKE